MRCPKLLVTSLPWHTASNHRSLAALHCSGGTFQHVTDLAGPQFELELNGPLEASDRLRAIRHRLHPLPHDIHVLWALMAIARLDRLLHHCAVLQQGDVARVVDLVELQLDLNLAMRGVLVHIIVGAMKNGLLTFAHSEQSLLNYSAQGAQAVRADVVVDPRELLDHTAVLRERLHRQADLAALLGVDPRLATLVNDGLDAPLIAEQVVLGDPADELDLEDKHRAGRNGRRLPALPIGVFGLDREPRPLALDHRREPQIPALDHLAPAEGELDGLSAIP
mmetsp:Transcript_65104/g.187322  ORF Transcript_65104/g.187322 Transcript_65104/m.187322 type:complete len:279 (-) Transcript_65104:270-1106(-)